MHARPSQVHLTKGVYRTKYFYKQNPSGGHCKQQLQRHLIASHLKTIIQCIADASMLRTCSHRGLFFLRCLTLLQFILQINSWLWAPIINTGQVPHNSEQLAARLIAIERWVEQLFLWMAQWDIEQYKWPANDINDNSILYPILTESMYDKWQRVDPNQKSTPKLYNVFLCFAPLCCRIILQIVAFVPMNFNAIEVCVTKIMI